MKFFAIPIRSHVNGILPTTQYRWNNVEFIRSSQALHIASLLRSFSSAMAIFDFLVTLRKEKLSATKVKTSP